jgi:hypothetical protein
MLWRIEFGRNVNLSTLFFLITFNSHMVVIIIINLIFYSTTLFLLMKKKKDSQVRSLSRIPTHLNLVIHGVGYI